MSTEYLYDHSLSLIEPVKRAIIHCPECEAEFFGPRAATAFIEHSCDSFSNNRGNCDPVFVVDRIGDNEQ